MFRKWKFIFLMTISVLALAACGKSLDEKATSGVDAREKHFIRMKKIKQKKLTALNYTTCRI